MVRDSPIQCKHLLLPLRGTVHMFFVPKTGQIPQVGFFSYVKMSLSMRHRAGEVGTAVTGLPLLRGVAVNRSCDLKEAATRPLVATVHMHPRSTCAHRVVCATPLSLTDQQVTQRRVPNR